MATVAAQATRRSSIMPRKQGSLHFLFSLISGFGAILSQDTSEEVSKPTTAGLLKSSLLEGKSLLVDAPLKLIPSKYMLK